MCTKLEKSESIEKKEDHTNFLAKNKNYLIILISILALVISVFSVLIADDANEQSKIIKQATLQIGHLKFHNNTLIICFINNYYARYPSLITSATVCIENDCENIYIKTEVSDWLLVERDEPKYLNVAFDEENIKNIPDGVLNISLKIRYVDFGEMVLKSTTGTYEISILNHNITNVDLVNVKQETLNKIKVES